MLADKDRIFTNIYGWQPASLAAAKKRGDWDKTASLMKAGPDAVVETVKASGLRVAAVRFPDRAEMVLHAERGKDRPHYLVVNADESEPGTCKDRDIIRHEPHKLIEGCLLAGFAMRANAGYIYIRGEFVNEAAALQRAIDEAYDAGLLAKCCKIRMGFRSLPASRCRRLYLW